MKADACLPAPHAWGPAEASPSLAPGDARAFSGVRPPLLYILRVLSPAERRLEKDAPLLPKGRRAFLHAAHKEAGRGVSLEEETDGLSPELLQTWGSPWRMEPQGLPGPWLPRETAGQRPEHRKGRGLALAYHTETRLPKACWLLPGSWGPGHVSLAQCPLRHPEAQLASGTAALSLPGWSPLPSYGPCPAS